MRGGFDGPVHDLLSSLSHGQDHPQYMSLFAILSVVVIEQILISHCYASLLSCVRNGVQHICFVQESSSLHDFVKTARDKAQFILDGADGSEWCNVKQI